MTKVLKARENRCNLILPGKIPELDEAQETHRETTSENDKHLQGTQAAANPPMNEILNDGMRFLSGLIKMTTGEEPKIQPSDFTYDEDSGEITMKFKIPKSS